MACKRAIVCTNVGGLDRFIDRHQCGIHAEAGNIVDYVVKVKFLLDNPVEREKRAENGYNAAINELDWNKIANKILAVTGITGKKYYISKLHKNVKNFNSKIRKDRTSI